MCEDLNVLEIIHRKITGKRPNNFRMFHIYLQIIIYTS